MSRTLDQVFLKKHAIELLKLAYHPSWILWIDTGNLENRIMEEIRSLYEKMQAEYCTDEVETVISYDDVFMAASELGSDLYDVLISGYTEEFQDIIIGGSWGSEIHGRIWVLVNEMIELLGITIRD